MGEIIAVSTLQTLFWAAVGLLLARYALKWFDSVSGFDFGLAIAEVQSDSLSAAIYLGMRFIGICLLVGFAVS